MNVSIGGSATKNSEKLEKDKKRDNTPFYIEFGRGFKSRLIEKSGLNSS